MSKRSINQAIRRHQAATTPAAIREVLRAAKGRPYRKLITAAGVRADAAADLRDAIAAEANQ
jgi:hypothetical protein